MPFKFKTASCRWLGALSPRATPSNIIANERLSHLRPPARHAVSLAPTRQAQAVSTELQQPQARKDLVDACAAELQPQFFAIDRLVHRNMRRVRRAFMQHGADACLAGTMAPAAAWAAVDGVVADVMGTDAALLRMSVLSGLHLGVRDEFGALL